MPPRKRLGQLLTELGVIDEHQLQSALGHQKQWGGKLGAVLVQKGFCKEADVVGALSKHLGMPAVKLADAKIDPRAVKFVSKQIAEKLHVFPYEISGMGRTEVVTIAMSDPTDLSAVDQLAFHTGKRIKPILAGDSEIVQAIHAHYGGGEEKAKPAAPPEAPAGARPPAPPPPAAAPVSPEFPKRIGPLPVSTPAAGSARATPAAGSARATPAFGTPYIPPPIPAQAAKPAQKLEEIEPDETMAVPTPPPPKPEPLEIPEDDGQMMGLEPIAAHSQFGDQVAGQEDVDGAGSAGDAVEGLVTASVPHEGVAEAGQIEDLEPIAAHAQVPVPEGGWGAAAVPAEAWQGEAAPAESAAPEQSGWGEETPAAAAPSGGFGAAEDWGSVAQHHEGWGAEQPAAGGGEQPPAEGTGWGAEQPWGAEAGAGEAPAAGADQSGEQLPMDAIIGTAETTESAVEAPAWDAGAAAEAAPEQAEHDHERDREPEHGHEHQHEPGYEHEHEHVAEPHAEQTEAPDAWASSDDPLAAGGEGSAWVADAQQVQAWSASSEPSADSPSTDKFAPVSAAEETAVESAAAETEAPPTEFAAAETEAPPTEFAAAETEAPPTEFVAAETEAPPTEFAAAESEVTPRDFAALETDVTPREFAAAETEAPPEWGETPAEPQIEPSAESPRDVGAEAALASGAGAAAEVAAHEFAAEEPPQELVAEVPHQEFISEEPHREVFAEESHQEFAAEVPYREPVAEEQHHVFAEEAPSEDISFDEAPAEPAEQGDLTIEGWIAPPPEPEPQGSGWLGQALASTTPLSTADLGTLVSIGVDPNDGVGALRLLAAVVRVLNRGQHLDLNEVAIEISESRAQAAAEHAAALPETDGTAASAAPEDQQPPAEPAET
jgi:type IV pilus assembly protein PilB